MTTTTASVFFLIFLFWPILQLQLLGIRKQPQEENFLVQHMGDSGPDLSWLPDAGCESGTLATACRMAVCPRDDVVIQDSWPKIFFLALSCYVRILDSRFAIHDSRLDPCVSYRKKCMFCLLSTHSATNFRMVGYKKTAALRRRHEVRFKIQSGNQQRAANQRHHDRVIDVQTRYVDEYHIARRPPRRAQHHPHAVGADDGQVAPRRTHSYQSARLASTASGTDCHHQHSIDTLRLAYPRLVSCHQSRRSQPILLVLSLLFCPHSRFDHTSAEALLPPARP